MGAVRASGMMAGVGGDTRRPFLRDGSARSDRQLRKHVKLLPGVYAPPGTRPTACVKAEAAWLYGRGRGVLGGRSAGAVLGMGYLDDRRRRTEPAVRREPYRYRARDWDEYEYFDTEPAVLIRPRGASNRAPEGLMVHNIDLPDSEIIEVGGMRVTSPARTGFDLARWDPSVQPGRSRDKTQNFRNRLVLVDGLCHATQTTPNQILFVAAAHPRASGNRRVDEVLALADGGAESPQETKLRLMLHTWGFPRPRTQVPVLTAQGELHGRVDLAWPQWKVGVEYDGEWHERSPQQKAKDKIRYARFRELGWEVLQVDKHLLATESVLAEYVDGMLSRGRERAGL